ncbi:MAG: peptide deformylase [Planctomycetes bacterium]|nr:peptide deformylase [Planctomycetota bacterium]
MADTDYNECQITHYPAPVLSKSAQPIEVIDESIVQLADKMIDIMLETKGIGLAAPQAGVNLRIFVISLDGTRESAKVYINPTIETSGKLEPSEEGCLSLPNISGKVKRFTNCKVTAQDLEGNTFTEEGDQLYARALQHEHDHLEGTLIKDKMSRVQMIGRNSRELRALEENNGDQ